MQALKNAKQDHEKTLEDMEALRQAFDEAESDVRESSVQREEELVKEHKHKVEDLSLEIVALTEANKALKDVRPRGLAVYKSPNFSIHSELCNVCSAPVPVTRTVN